MSTSPSITRWSGPAAFLGGAVWLVIWILFLMTHGPDPDDTKGTVLTLIYNDYSKFIVIPLVLFAIALGGVQARQQRSSGRRAKTGFALGLTALSLMTVGSALSYWPIPWGSYGVDLEAPLAMLGGIAASLSTLVLAIGHILFGIGTLRARVWPAWVALALVVGPLTVVLWLQMTVYGGLFGVTWLVLGYALLSIGSDVRVNSKVAVGWSTER